LHDNVIILYFPGTDGARDSSVLGGGALLKVWILYFAFINIRLLVATKVKCATQKKTMTHDP
jgi:hypothetical protein